MVIKIILYINIYLRLYYGKLGKPFGLFWVIFVGNLRQLPPVGDYPIYIKDKNTEFSLYQQKKHFWSYREAKDKLIMTQTLEVFKAFYSIVIKVHCINRIWVF